VLELARGFALALEDELDFRVEARNLRAIQQAVTGSAAGRRIHVPEV
jgi:predicted unusual protein kinase regulating ubiquinone biosynthesis (AarF/ABC1/UbiB family)